MTEMPRRLIRGAAIIDGAPARLLVAVLPMSELERRLDDGGIPACPERAATFDAWQAVAVAAQEHVAFVRGRLTGRTTEAAADSDCECSTEEVASMLCVTESRIRQLARAGELPGRQHAGRWFFRRADVAAYQKARTR